MVNGRNGLFGVHALRVQLLLGTALEVVQILSLRLVARNAAEPQLCLSFVLKTVPVSVVQFLLFSIYGNGVARS